MALISKTDHVQRRLLEAWQAPAGSGDPVGVLATTFTLDTAFFEEECLARFAGVQSDARRDGALYRLEREERLAQLRCAAVIADIRHAGGSRSLRWDLLSARPATGVMHAKITVLAWERHVRVIVGSANLTGEAYRRSQECAGVLDFSESSADRALLDPVIAFLENLLQITSGAGSDRAQNLLTWVKTLPWRTPASSRGLQRRWVFVAPGGRPGLLAQLAEALPGRADAVHIVSPFFDKEAREVGPERAIWRELVRARGAASVHYHVAGEPRGDGEGWRLAIPRHVAESRPDGHRANATVALHAIEVQAVREGQGFGGPGERRPLHAKSIALSAGDWTALLIGSSNFTTAGTGLDGSRVVNYEANLLYWVKAPKEDALRRNMEMRLHQGAEVPAAASHDYDPVFDADEATQADAPPLPAFFGEVVLERLERDELDLRFEFSDVASPLSWRVSDRNRVVIDSAEWQRSGSPRSMRRTCARQSPTPSTLRVEWRRDAAMGSSGADWPVNVRVSEVLPVPDELQELSLAALLDLLGSARPLHQALRDWLRRQPDDDEAEPDVAAELVDPHAKVDTSGFLVQRVRRVCWAMRHLRERLEQPVGSVSAWTWRLQGPVGARALLEAMLRQADPAMPDEAAFLIVELDRELEAVRITAKNDDELHRTAVLQLQSFRDDLRRRLNDMLPTCSPELRRFAALSLDFHEALA